MATAATTDKFNRVTDSTTGRPVITKLGGSGKTVGASSITIANNTNWTTSSKIHFAIYLLTSAGVKDPTTQTDWTGTLIGSTISNLTLTGGTDRSYTTDAYVDPTPTSAWAKDLYDGLAVAHNPDGSLLTSAVQTALSLGTGSLNGWNALGFAPATVTANGNRSYDLVFTGQDLTGTLSAGMRLRTTRTVAAPTQCTSLNGTTQYYSKASPASMTFTDDFVVGAWVKLSSYAASTIISRYNGTSGWCLITTAAGQIQLQGFNAGAANTRSIQSYQSIPLNKWVHVTAQLDMSTNTSTTTTSYIMIDGVDVPAQSITAGTNPTALVQAGNLEIGSQNGGLFPFPGKIAQAFVASAKITQANVRTLMSQGLTTALCTANNIVSAYSFNASTSDITVAANNLTANGSAVATNADSPFGIQAGGSISSTLDYAIIQTATFSTNTTVTVQVPEGGTIPTSGGVASVVYSSQGKPYGMPTQKDKWQLLSLYLSEVVSPSVVANTGYNPNKTKLTLPVGAHEVTYSGSVFFDGTGAVDSFMGLNDAAIPAISSSLVSMSYTSTGTIITKHTATDILTMSTQTPVYCNFISNTTALGVRWYTPPSLSQPAILVMTANNAYL